MNKLIISYLGIILLLYAFIYCNYPLKLFKIIFRLVTFSLIQVIIETLYFILTKRYSIDLFSTSITITIQTFKFYIA